MSWNAAQIYFYQFLAILLGLVSNIIIARLLGPKEKGVYDLYVLLSNFISEIGTLGFGYGLLYYLLSQCRAIAEVHGTGLVFSAVMGLVTAAIGFSGLAILRSSFQGLPDWIILLCFFSSPSFKHSANCGAVLFRFIFIFSISKTFDACSRNTVSQSLQRSAIIMCFNHIRSEKKW